MKVKSESEVDQSCRTLSDPMDCSPPGSFVPGIFQLRVLEWGAIVFFRLLKLVSCYLKTEMLITKRTRMETSSLPCLSFPHSSPPPPHQLFINSWNNKFTSEPIKSWLKVSEKERLLERISFTIPASNGLVVFKASFLRTYPFSKLPRGLEEQEYKAEVQASNVAPTRAALGLSLLNVFCSIYDFIYINVCPAEALGKIVERWAWFQSPMLPSCSTLLSGICVRSTPH